MERLLAALVAGRSRVERLELADRTVWIKRYAGREGLMRVRAQSLLARLLGEPMLRPSPVLSPDRMIGRETGKMAAFKAAGFRTAGIVYRGPRALVLENLGRNLGGDMRDARGEPVSHDALLVRCATEIGRLHRAGLCHGRPHPRDFVITADDAFAFLDFEEDPEAVMPLASAQARDVLLLFLQIATRSLLPETPERAYAAWAAQATPAAVAELSRIVARLAPLLVPVRAVQRIRPGQDVARFIAAVETLQQLTGTSTGAAHRSGEDRANSSPNKAKTP
ncbi:serine/threonine protein phosphatase [Rhizobium sp. SG2393]|uniref:serine/threonine protein phosphatase n=1 Tax=Rhizobium sp. SG2393 TaxID=3276279 RepID=UPI00366F6524